MTSPARIPIPGRDDAVPTLIAVDEIRADAEGTPGTARSTVFATGRR